MGFEGNEIVGAVMGYLEQYNSSQSYYLKEMFVRADQRRRGLGAELLDALETHLKSGGVRNIYLITARDGVASAFYGKHGYRSNPGLTILGKRIDGE